MGTHLLISTTPKHGRQHEALEGMAMARKVMAPHAARLLCWRTTIGGPNTGRNWVSMSWPNSVAMTAGIGAMQQDPAYVEFMQKHQIGDTPIVAAPELVMGFDVPGFEAEPLPENTTGVPRSLALITYEHNPEVLGLLAESRAAAEERGWGWYARAWAVGIPGVNGVISVYNVHESFAAFGAAMDRMIASPAVELLQKARPHIRGRSVLAELL